MDYRQLRGDATKKIRQVSPDVKIVLLSQNSSNEVMQVALVTGADGYVLQLNAASELLSAIAAALPDDHQLDRIKRLHFPAD
jgi:DNA-binding NarL/FixJ family response regulator